MRRRRQTPEHATDAVDDGQKLPVRLIKVDVSSSAAGSGSETDGHGVGDGKRTGRIVSSASLDYASRAGQPLPFMLLFRIGQAMQRARRCQQRGGQDARSWRLVWTWLLQRVGKDGGGR